ncbi:MAG: hypothetical protein KDA30_13740 [Phycisphaerales bacterium]|nr:hypothetical protein [Phycisphaerales bacterium]
MTRILRRILPDWRKTRALGELKFLTKASYVALIVVPILAATWPSARIIVNQYNRSASRASDQIQAAAKKLATAVEDAELVLDKHEDRAEHPIHTSLEGIRAEIDAAHREYSPDSLPSPLLPTSWVLAFFAAVLVVIGHAVYEMFAPDMVKTMSMRECVDDTLVKHKEMPSKTKLDSARGFLNYVYSEERDAISINPRISHALRTSDIDSVDDIDWIEEAARVGYLRRARQKQGIAAVVFVLYGSAILTLAWILWLQSIAVLNSAGIL